MSADLPASNRSQVSKVVHGMLNGETIYAVKATKGIRFSAADLAHFAPTNPLEDFTISPDSWNAFREVDLGTDAVGTEFRCWVGHLTVPLRDGPRRLHIQTFYRDVLSYGTALLGIAGSGPDQPELLSEDEMVALFEGIGPPDESLLDDSIEPRREAVGSELPTEATDFRPANIPEAVQSEIDAIMDALINRDIEELERRRDKGGDESIAESGFTIDHGWAKFLRRVNVDFVPLPPKSIDNDHVGTDLHELAPGESTWLDVVLHTPTGPSDLTAAFSVDRKSDGTYAVTLDNIGS